MVERVCISELKIHQITAWFNSHPAQRIEFMAQASTNEIAFRALLPLANNLSPTFRSRRAVIKYLHSLQNDISADGDLLSSLDPPAWATARQRAVEHRNVISVRRAGLMKLVAFYIQYRLPVRVQFQIHVNREGRYATLHLEKYEQRMRETVPQNLTVVPSDIMRSQVMVTNPSDAMQTAFSHWLKKPAPTVHKFPCVHLDNWSRFQVQRGMKSVVLKFNPRFPEIFEDLSRHLHTDASTLVLMYLGD